METEDQIRKITPDECKYCGDLKWKGRNALLNIYLSGKNHISALILNFLNKNYFILEINFMILFRDPDKIEDSEPINVNNTKINEVVHSIPNHKWSHAPEVSMMKASTCEELEFKEFFTFREFNVSRGTLLIGQSLGRLVNEIGNKSTNSRCCKAIWALKANILSKFGINKKEFR
ncbi:hypothetical protein RCL_jg20518.t1 [Rhizophagus clarus]|uniref:Uncharacterized protein n=1 Tax=Rhizophagus clarus TaxID=94130 RepID=A0A8H3LVC5_9GLOM|nr:hypothetical protein RCL_jg20518.t1 [Rhizophagus clarus]